MKKKNNKSLLKRKKQKKQMKNKKRLNEIKQMVQAANKASNYSKRMSTLDVVKPTHKRSFISKTTGNLAKLSSQKITLTAVKKLGKGIFKGGNTNFEPKTGAFLMKGKDYLIHERTWNTKNGKMVKFIKLNKSEMEIFWEKYIEDRKSLIKKVETNERYVEDENYEEFLRDAKDSNFTNEGIDKDFKAWLTRGDRDDIIKQASEHITESAVDVEKMVRKQVITGLRNNFIDFRNMTDSEVSKYILNPPVEEGKFVKKAYLTMLKEELKKLGLA